MKKLLRYPQSTRGAHLEMIGKLGAHDKITALPIACLAGLGGSFLAAAGASVFGFGGVGCSSWAPCILARERGGMFIWCCLPALLRAAAAGIYRAVSSSIGLIIYRVSVGLTSSAGSASGS